MFSSFIPEKTLVFKLSIATVWEALGVCFVMSGVTASLANGGATFPGSGFNDNLGNDSVLVGSGAGSNLGGPGSGTLAGGLGNDSILGGNDAIIAGNSAVRR